MSKVQLHYIYDPLCGWCYAAAPLISAASHLPQFSLALHAGGLWMGDNRPQLGKALLDYVRPHDERIQSLTGQPFGERYFNELLLDTRHQLDSEPLIRAIRAVEFLQGDPLQMLHRIQQTHYRDGVWTNNEKVLVTLAGEQEIAAEQFIRVWNKTSIATHLENTHQLLALLRTSGYPRLALQRDNNIELLDVSSYLGKVDKFIAYLHAKKIV